MASQARRAREVVPTSPSNEQEDFPDPVPFSSFISTDEESNSILVRQVAPSARTTPHPDAQVLSQSEIAKLKPMEWTLGVLSARQAACPFRVRDAFLVSVSIYTNQIEAATYTAYHCMKTDKLWVRLAGKGKMYKHDNTRFAYVTPSACRYMVKNSYSPIERQFLHPLNSTWRGTENTISVRDSHFFETDAKNVTVTNYYYQKVNLTLNVETGFMQSDSLRIEPNCTYQKTSCSSTKGMLVWNVAYQSIKPEHCETKVRRSDSCWITSTSLVCPELGLSFMDHTRDGNTCGVSVGFGRALVQKDSHFSSFEFNQLEMEYNLDLHLDFIKMFHLISAKEDEPAFIKILHIGACDFYGTNLTITN